MTPAYGVWRVTAQVSPMHVKVAPERHSTTHGKSQKGINDANKSANIAIIINARVHAVAQRPPNKLASCEQVFEKTLCARRRVVRMKHYEAQRNEESNACLRSARNCSFLTYDNARTFGRRRETARNDWRAFLRRFDGCQTMRPHVLLRLHRSGFAERRESRRQMDRTGVINSCERRSAQYTVIHTPRLIPRARRLLVQVAVY